MQQLSWLFSEALAELATLNAAAGPFAATAALAAACAAASYAANVATGYWSWVDRLWSLLPPIYAVIFATWPAVGEGAGSTRLSLIAALVLAWGARLTYNFYRKGGYGAEEDYRWPVVRAWFAQNDPLAPLGREVFSLVFVAMYQHALIWAFSVLPLYVVWHERKHSSSLNGVDVAASLVFLAALALEVWTDETQFAFQTRKHALSARARADAGGDLARGFCSSSGPFRYSRHANFFAEQSIWWCLCGFAVAAGAPLIHWSAVGALLLSGLFQGSTYMTEYLSASKYPAYFAYQETTSRLLPWFPGPSLDSTEGKALIARAAARARPPRAAGAAYHED